MTRWLMLQVWYPHGYRWSMRLLHLFNLHYSPPSHLTNEAGWPLHRCDWCGLSGFVMPVGAAINLVGKHDAEA